MWLEKFLADSGLLWLSGELLACENIIVKFRFRNNSELIILTLIEVSSSGLLWLEKCELSIIASWKYL